MTRAIPGDVDRRIRAMRVRRYSLDEIAADTGLTPQQVASRITMIWQKAEADCQQPAWGDPTPQEIAERAAEIRERWSEHDYRVRSGTPEPAIEPQRFRWTGTAYDAG